MGEIIIANEQYYVNYLAGADAAGNANGRIDTDDEFLAAADAYCADNHQFCNVFFKEWKDKGFSKLGMSDLFHPGSKFFVATEAKAEACLKDLVKPKACNEAQYELRELIRHGIPAELMERVLDGALKALDGKAKDVRMSASAVLGELAQSGLQAESIERMIDPLVGSIGHDYYVYDYGNSEIAPALGYVSASDVSADEKLEMTKKVMVLTTSKDQNKKAEAELALHFIAASIIADDAKALADLFIGMLEDPSAKMRSTAMSGLYAMAKPDAAQELKMEILEHVLDAVNDESLDVRLHVIGAVRALLESGLPQEAHTKAIGILKGFLESKDKKIRQCAAFQLSVVAEGMNASEELRAEVAPMLLDALQGDDAAVREQAVQGLARLFDAGILKEADAKTIYAVIALLKSDDDYAREAARKVLLSISESTPEPMLSKINQALTKGDYYAPPEVLKVKGTGSDGKVLKSKKYITTFKFSSVPKGAVKIMPVLNGWDQKKGKIKGGKATAAVWMDWRDEYTMAVIKFYNAKGKFIGETDQFELKNPGYKELEY